MYELPLMGHTLVAYCRGGKFQNIEGVLKAWFKNFLLIQTSFLVVQCYSHKIELEGYMLLSYLIGGFSSLKPPHMYTGFPASRKKGNGICVQSKKCLCQLLTRTGKIC